jgi:hypothetical protein
MNFKERPKLFKLYQESKPHIDLLYLVSKIDDENAAE